MSDPRYDPRFQRGGDQDGSVEPAAVASTVRSMDATRSRNPWLALLWVLAALLTLGGIAALLVVGAVELAPPSDPFTYYVLTALLEGVAPWLLGSGLFAVVGAGFIHALEWRRRREAVAAEQQTDSEVAG